MPIVFGSPEANALAEKLRQARVEEAQEKELLEEVQDISSRIGELEDSITDAEFEIECLESDIAAWELELAALRRLQKSMESSPEKATYIESPTLTPALLSYGDQSE